MIATVATCCAEQLFPPRAHSSPLISSTALVTICVDCVGRSGREEAPPSHTQQPAPMQHSMRGGPSFARTLAAQLQLATLLPALLPHLCVAVAAPRQALLLAAAEGAGRLRDALLKALVPHRLRSWRQDNRQSFVRSPARSTEGAPLARRPYPCRTAPPGCQPGHSRAPHLVELLQEGDLHFLLDLRAEERGGEQGVRLQAAHGGRSGGGPAGALPPAARGCRPAQLAAAVHVLAAERNPVQARLGLARVGRVEPHMPQALARRPEAQRAHRVHNLPLVRLPTPPSARSPRRVAHCWSPPCSAREVG